MEWHQLHFHLFHRPSVSCVCFYDVENVIFDLKVLFGPSVDPGKRGFRVTLPGATRILIVLNMQTIACSMSSGLYMSIASCLVE